MPAEPLVSVVIPAYNQGRFLGEAIESVLDQDYPHLELIVVDDGSTDETPAVIAGYGSGLTSIRQRNRGAAAALNRGIEAARGDLICWLSSDDAFAPGKIGRQVEAFSADPGLALCFTGFEIVDPEGAHLRAVADSPWVHPDLFVTVFWRNPLNGSTAMVPRWVFEAIGRFNQRLRADVDGEMWLRILDRHPARVIPGVFLRYRVHPAAISANLDLMRRTKTAVRLARVRDGSLVRHLRASGDPEPPTTLARMSLDFTRGHMPELGRALLDASRREGPSPEAQLAAEAAWRAVRRAAMRRSPILRSPLLLPARAARRWWRGRGEGAATGGTVDEADHEETKPA